ncbi:MAG TPA: hypothetical protein VIK74_08720, partial [Parasegetibacter sp.]
MKIFYFALIVLLSGNVSAQQQEMLIRISEIEIYPEFLTDYKSILKREAAASVRIEKGVLAIFPMFQKDASTRIRILEIYANGDAYQS